MRGLPRPCRPTRHPSSRVEGGAQTSAKQRDTRSPGRGRALLQPHERRDASRAGMTRSGCANRRMSRVRGNRHRLTPRARRVELQPTASHSTLPGARRSASQSSPQVGAVHVSVSTRKPAESAQPACSARCVPHGVPRLCKSRNDNTLRNPENRKSTGLPGRARRRKRWSARWEAGQFGQFGYSSRTLAHVCHIWKLSENLSEVSEVSEVSSLSRSPTRLTVPLRTVP